MALKAEIQYLKEKDAKLVTHSRNPLTRDWELVTKWEVSDVNFFASLLTTLETYGSVGPGSLGSTPDPIVDSAQLTAKKYVDDPMANGKVYAGRWRVISVAPFAPGSSKKDSDGVYRVLRRGYMTALDWTEARISGETSKLPGNALSVPGVAGTTSDNPCNHYFCKFYNVSPDHWKSIMASIAVGTVHEGDITIQGQNIGNGWHIAMARPQQADDGSYTIDVLLSKAQFVVADYSDAGGDRQVRRWHIHGVPRALGQTIINAWELLGPGRSASNGAGADSPYMTITLTLDSPVLQNLTVGPIPTSCDTSLTLHFGWGYSKIEAGEFITSHSGVQGAGMSRRIRQVQTRGNGLFDITIEEETIAFDEGKHVVTFTLDIGANVENVKEWGWHAPMSRLDAIKAAYDHGKRGWRSNFELTRKDNCTFDYVGTIEKETNDTATVATTTPAIAETIVGNTAMTPEQITSAAVTDDVDGVSFQNDLVNLGNGLWKWFRRKILRLPLNVTVTGGTAYMTITRVLGLYKRADAAELMAAAPSVVGVSISAVADVEPDGMVKVDKATATKSALTVPGIKSGTVLEPETSEFGLNTDAIAKALTLGTAPVRGEKRLFELVLDRTADGTAVHRLVEIAGGEYVATPIVIFNNGLVKITETQGQNKYVVADISLGASLGDANHQINERALSNFAKRVLTLFNDEATLQVTVDRKSRTEEDRHLKYVDPTLRKRTYDANGKLEKITEYVNQYVIELLWTRAITEVTVRTYSLASLSADTTSTSATQDQESNVEHDPRWSMWIKNTMTRTKGTWDYKNPKQNYIGLLVSSDS